MMKFKPTEITTILKNLPIPYDKKFMSFESVISLVTKELMREYNKEPNRYTLQQDLIKGLYHIKDNEIEVRTEKEVITLQVKPPYIFKEETPERRELLKGMYYRGIAYPNFDTGDKPHNFFYIRFYSGSPYKVYVVNSETGLEDSALIYVNIKS